MILRNGKNTDLSSLVSNSLNYKWRREIAYQKYIEENGLRFQPPFIESSRNFKKEVYFYRQKVKQMGL